jgi:mRNA-degrading endonuclease RelE of RelBE toxin-antitoxin system
VTDPDKETGPDAQSEPESELWEVKLTGPARRALETGLPEAVAWAAYTFVTERLPTNPYRLGGELAGPFQGMRSAHLGTYRVVYRIDDENRVLHVLSIRLRGDVYGIR